MHVLAIALTDVDICFQKVLYLFKDFNLWLRVFSAHIRSCALLTVIVLCSCKNFDFQVNVIS